MAGGGRKPRPSGDVSLSGLKADGAGREILMYTLGLLDLDYKFGGANPEAGLDCSGMVSYIYQNAVGVKLPHNAAQIANVARPIPDSRMRVGDLVFFNTMNRPFSHMGIFIGDAKFVHAPLPIAPSAWRGWTIVISPPVTRARARCSAKNLFNVCRVS